MPLRLGATEVLAAQSVEVMDQLFIWAGLTFHKQLLHTNVRPDVLLSTKDNFRQGRFMRQALFPSLPPYAGKKPTDR